jgi:allophanate hydrolase
MITVTSAPPFATIQDLGRTSYRDCGVPPSGLADRDSGLALNAVLGNDANAAIIEWAVAGGALRFETDCAVAVGGAEAECFVDGRRVETWASVWIHAGAELRIDRITRGRFLLIAVRGGIDVPVVMGSRSTLLSAALGGLEGRRLRKGDTLSIGDMWNKGASRIAVGPVEFDGTVRIVRGPQAEHFDSAAWETLLGAEFIISHASDRTGFRLQGPALRSRFAADLPSEPTCVGAIQVPDGGEPIVIMQDGPTIGGYPKIAVIRSAWISRFAQLAPGERVRFAIDE